MLYRGIRNRTYFYIGYFSISLSKGNENTLIKPLVPNGTPHSATGVDPG